MSDAREHTLRLAGVHEVAELLGITKSALADRRRHASFPSPLAELRCGPIWDLAELEGYKSARARDPFAAYRWKPGRWDYYRRSART